MPGEFAVVLIPNDEGLAAAQVYAHADELGIGRTVEELEEIEVQLREATVEDASPLEYASLLRNDLEQAAVSLRPQIAEALDALEEVGARRALVTGSGPTVAGIFDDMVAADHGAAELPPRYAHAIVSAPPRLG
jgi:4-diphosphocytidyl-2-C-methyl-D-erythritol kinase